MKCEGFLAYYNHYFGQKKSINNPEACVSLPILISEFPSIQGGRNFGSRRSQDPTIIDRIRRRISTMLLVIPPLSFLYTMLGLIDYTSTYISFGHSVNVSVVITRRLFESSHECAAIVLLLLLLRASGEGHNLYTTRISTTISLMISVPYQTISLVIKITIPNPMPSIFADHLEQQWASGHQMIPSCQHLENKSHRLNQLLHQCYPYIMSVGRSILSWRRGIEHETAPLVSKKVFDSAFRQLNSPVDVYIYKRKELKEASDQLVEWIAGNLWRYEPFVDDLTGLIIGAEHNAQTPPSGVTAMVMAYVKPRAVHYAMFMNPFATNVVKTT